MDQASAAKAAEIFFTARQTREIPDALPEDLQPQDFDDAYLIQDALAVLMGENRSGWKIGGTNRAPQAEGSDQPSLPTNPLAGRLYWELTHNSPAHFKFSDFFAPIIEGEIAFRLGADLPASGAPYDRDAVAGAVAAILPTIDVIDPHIGNWKTAGSLTSVADSAYHGGFIIGAEISDWQNVDLRALEGKLIINDEVVATGKGADILGDPIEAAVWLANDRAVRGGGLKAGEILSTGACVGPRVVARGDICVADFGELGLVSIEFAA